MTKDDNDLLAKTEENWKLFTSLLDKLPAGETTDALVNFCDEQVVRLMTCPASSRSDRVGAFPGGLVWHSLNVLKIMKDLNKLYGAGISSDKLIMTALFHDVGKIGTETEDYYIPQTSNWHAERGMLYEFNQKVEFCPIPTRSLWWLNHYGAKLPSDVFSAIMSLNSLDKMYSNELYKAPLLTLILQQAVRAATVINRQTSSVLGS